MAPSRGGPLVRLSTLVVAVVLSSLAGCRAFELEQKPRFTTYAASFPPARDHYPAAVDSGARWGSPSPAQISGFDLMVAFKGDRLEWQIHYDYDGCHVPPAGVPETRCKRTHCLDIAGRSREDPADSYGNWSHIAVDQ